MPRLQEEEAHVAEYVTYCRAKALYDLREFKRAAFVLKDCRSNKSFFLRCYCLYLVSCWVEAQIIA
jgi:hypothetical protein